MSYYVRYWSKDWPRRALIGGVARSESSRFSHREDAELRVWSIVTVHAGLEPPLEVGTEIIESSEPAEIIRHCEGAPAQVVGARCPKCKQTIEKEER